MTLNRRPMFVDGSSNGAVNLYFDGTHMLDFSQTTGTPGPGPSGSGNLSNGGSYTWSSVISDVGNQAVATVTVNYNTIPGPHTIGAVQTNGACPVGGDPCMSNSPGYVLAEGQTTQVLQPGNNNATALYLRGVVESMYICDPGCQGQNLVVDSNGDYDLYVVAADENGTAITYQTFTDSTGNTQVVPFDNGTFSLHDTAGILSIDKPGPFSTPGTDHANGGYGVDIKVHCTKTGTTTLYAQLDGNGGTPSNPVTGFSVTPGTNYPTANQIVGSVGADEYYGNQLPLNCNAGGSITIE